MIPKVLCNMEFLYQQDYVGHGLITKNSKDFSAWNAV